MLPFIWEICLPCYVAVAILLHSSQCMHHSTSKDSQWIVTFSVKIFLLFHLLLPLLYCGHLIEVTTSADTDADHLKAMLLLSALFLCRNIDVTVGTNSSCHSTMTLILLMLCHHCDACYLVSCPRWCCSFGDATAIAVTVAVAITIFNTASWLSFLLFIVENGHLCCCHCNCHHHCHGYNCSGSHSHCLHHWLLIALLDFKYSSKTLIAVTAWLMATAIAKTFCKFWYGMFVKHFKDLLNFFVIDVKCQAIVQSMIVSYI